MKTRKQRKPIAAGTWTREGRTLLLDGKPALFLEQVRDECQNSALPPVVCDAIADKLFQMLQSTDLDALYREWMRR